MKYVQRRNEITWPAVLNALYESPKRYENIYAFNVHHFNLI